MSANTPSHLAPDPVVQADRAQRRAAAADRSAWVAASAGSGKTKVLTDRVLSLLLAGGDPGRILCLTFTKAAAAEMAVRVTARLAKWAVTEEAALHDALAQLLGRQAHQDELLRARRLFARVLDVPGGMKIQTVHGFCQSVLRRFPLEAGISPQFEVLDPLSAAELAATASAQVLTRARAAAAADAPLAAALAVVNDGTSETVFGELVGDLVNARARVEAMLEHFGNVTGAIAALYRHIGADPEVTPAQARAALASGGADADLRLLAAAWAGGSASEQDRGASLTAWLATPPAARTAAYDGYRGLFLTTKGQVRKSLVTKATAEAHPGALAVAEAEADRLVAGEARFRAAVVARASAAVTTLGAAMLTAYERAKQARDWLDYEDLILRTRRLLMAPGGPSWVLYKLDGGIDHILVDEAQDTNPAQWQVIAKLAEGFFDASAGMGARSVFAVGDIKQSIFSFQGADPAGFTAMRRHFANAVGGAGGQWEDVPMNVSFRSAPAILAAVDAVFADPEMAAAVGEEVPIRHVSARPSVPGSVELWAPVTVGDEDAAAIWAPPDRQIAQDDPRHILAERIAGQVRQWLDDGTALASGERPIEAGDVMVLVRRRDALVEALARAFKRQGIPVAGVDRMILTDQLAVMDLIKLGEFLLLPEDDLTLATVLKSPLIGLDEADLFELAHDRGGAGLWRALRRRAHERPGWVRADAQLLAWLDRADRTPPHELFAGILAEGGWHAIIGRLGPDAVDPLDEFLSQALAYEQTHVPSLQGFLHWLAAAEFEVKRDLEGAGGGQVRIMTAHGAKVLQAPIVFLPDTLQVPKSTPRLLWDTDAAGAPLLLWPPRSGDDDRRAGTCRAAARAAQLAEYRRLLYVAMTRAEDHLIVCGWHGRQRPAENWYEAVAAGLARAGAAALEADETTPAPTILKLTDGPPPTATDTVALPVVEAPPPPPHFSVPPPPERWPSRPLTPSGARAEAPAVRSPVDAAGGDRFARGLLIHRLLQVLPEVAPPRRAAVGAAMLARPVHGLAAAEQAAYLAEVMAILDDPAYAAFFGPHARAEVPIVGQIGDGDAAVVVSGQIDRLAVLPDRVAIIDYKTNRPPPADVTGVAPAYLDQLRGYRDLVARLYPDRPVECYLVWTDGPRLMRVSDAILDNGAM